MPTIRSTISNQIREQEYYVIGGIGAQKSGPPLLDTLLGGDSFCLIGGDGSGLKGGDQ